MYILTGSQNIGLMEAVDQSLAGRTGVLTLLEIKDAAQLGTHYLRGGLFENMVVNEFLRRGLNRGTVPALSFWRDNTGNEVDLIYTEATAQHACEIKSGATFSKEFFKGLDYWGKLSEAGTECRTVKAWQDL